MPHATRSFRSQLTRATVTSTALHLALLAVLLHHRAPWIAPIRLPGTAHGTHLELTYSPGHPTASTATPIPRAAPPTIAHTAKPALPTPTPTPTPAAPNSTTDADPSTATGNDALGRGNVSIAFANFFPRPKPDLSPLAHGTAGDVILDITITADGKVTDIHLTQSLSPAIDQTVIATVQQWTFRPATKDGQPVPSEQELHFHYERT